MNDKSFLNLFITLDPLNKITTRKYDSIIDVLSKMGGLLKILTIVSTIFLKPFLRAALLQRVSNETFDYEEMRETQQCPKKHLKIKLHFWEFVKSKFMKKEKLEQPTRLMLKSIKVMKENLDISNLLNRMFDIEKIKMILNKEMEFLKNEKPKIIIDPNKIKKAGYKSDIVKKFQRKFLIITDSINRTHGFSEELKINEKNNELNHLEANNQFVDLSHLAPKELKMLNYNKNEKELKEIDDFVIEDELKINKSKNIPFHDKREFRTEL